GAIFPITARRGNLCNAETDIVHPPIPFIRRCSAVVALEQTSRRVIESVVIYQRIDHSALERAYFHGETERVNDDVPAKGIWPLAVLHARLKERHELGGVEAGIPFDQVVHTPGMNGFKTHTPPAVHGVVQPSIPVTSGDTKTCIVSAASQMIAPDHTVSAAALGG